MNEGLLLPMAFGNQTISRVKVPLVGSTKRFTALRPCFATGLPLSCNHQLPKSSAEKDRQVKLPERNLIVNADYTRLNSKDDFGAG